MSFKTQMAADSANVFLNGNEFAEAVTYIPHGGVSREINALVTRSRVQPAAETSSRSLVDQMEIQIANHRSSGASSIKKGFDKVIISDPGGVTDITYVVADILAQDEGMWHLLLRK